MKNKDRKIRVKFEYVNGVFQILNCSSEARSVLGDICQDLGAVRFEVLS